jgi:hypothetical protein
MKEKKQAKASRKPHAIGEFEGKKRKEAKTLPEFDPKKQGPI